jgi:tetratricopeptide (TPR) repeat protein
LCDVAIALVRVPFSIAGAMHFVFPIATNDNSNNTPASSGGKRLWQDDDSFRPSLETKKRSGNNNGLGSGYDLDLIPVPHSCDDVTIRKNPPKAFKAAATMADLIAAADILKEYVITIVVSAYAVKLHVQQNLTGRPSFYIGKETKPFRPSAIKRRWICILKPSKRIPRITSSSLIEGTYSSICILNYMLIFHSIRLLTAVVSVPWCSPHRSLFMISACYGALGQWRIACDDAKECIRLNPIFVKGYYRLASAQLELEEYDLAMATIRQGMAIDNNNAQLTKLLRIIQQQKKVAQAKQQQQSSQQMPVTAIGEMELSAAQELQELQAQQRNTSIELGTVQATAMRAQKEYSIANLTREELERSVPEEARCFRSIGKMFARTTRGDMLAHLQDKMTVQSKLGNDLVQKADYLERQLKSQQQNIQELIGSASSANDSAIAAS